MPLPPLHHEEVNLHSRNLDAAPRAVVCCCAGPVVSLCGGRPVQDINGCPEVFLAHLGINLGRIQAVVPQEFLDSPDVGSPLHQPGGKDVPEGMAVKIRPGL